MKYVILVSPGVAGVASNIVFEFEEGDGDERLTGLIRVILHNRFLKF